MKQLIYIKEIVKGRKLDKIINIGIKFELNVSMPYHDLFK